MLIILFSVASYTIVTLITLLITKRENIWKQRRLLMVLEGYILVSLISSIMILVGREYMFGKIVGLVDSLINFILHILLVPYVWYLIISRSKRYEERGK